MHLPIFTLNQIVGNVPCFKPQILKEQMSRNLKFRIFHLFINSGHLCKDFFATRHIISSVQRGIESSNLISSAVLLSTEILIYSFSHPNSLRTSQPKPNHPETKKNALHTLGSPTPLQIIWDQSLQPGYCQRCVIFPHE